MIPLTAHKAALDVVALGVAANAITGDMEPEWENYPDVGENDWLAIQGMLSELAKKLAPMIRSYATAYLYLTKLADGAES